MRRRLTHRISLSIASGAALACGLAVLGALSARATENGRHIDASRALDAGGLPGIGDVTITNTPPDPPPLVERSQWLFDLRWDKGEVFLLGTQPMELPAPRETPRAMGRFALELYEGPALLERVRFDFPLLGAVDPGDGGWDSAPQLTRKLRTRIGVVFPATSRGTRLELWDRATNRRWALPWPPTAAPATSAAASASGAPSAAPARVAASVRDGG
jgi:hypothetical protein